MRKVLFCLVLLFSCFITVHADNNKLYLFKKDDKVYYDESLFDKTNFFGHLDMEPGGVYKDNFSVENNTGIPLTLYFKLSTDDQSEAAKNLLDNMFMKIYLEDKLIYDGKAEGYDYNGVDLRNSILLANLDDKDLIKLHVEITLDKKYDNHQKDDLAYVDWIFYVEGDDNIVTEVEGVPITGSNPSIMYVIFSSIAFGIGLIIFIFLYKERKSE